jgi:hypothetical protein
MFAHLKLAEGSLGISICFHLATGVFQVLFQEFRHKLSVLEQQITIRGA